MQCNTVGGGAIHSPKGEVDGDSQSLHIKIGDKCERWPSTLNKREIDGGSLSLYFKDR